MRGLDSQTGQTVGNYFAVDGQPLGEKNPKWLNDDYVKFIRFAQWRIEQIVPNGGMSGDGRIDVSPDGQRLLLSMDMDEEYDRKNWDGPVPALWSYDLSTGASVRLTSKNLFAWDGCWLDDTNILFVSQGPQDKQAALYRANGKILKRLIENARRPTVSLLPK